MKGYLCCMLKPGEVVFTVGDSIHKWIVVSIMVNVTVPVVNDFLQIDYLVFILTSE